MSRRTSLEAYDSIRESGRLSEMRFAVYDLLYHYGPLTASQIDARLVADGKRPHHSKRLTELEDVGVVERIGEIKCPITQNLATLWDVTDQLPAARAQTAVGGCTLCKPGDRLIEGKKHYSIVRDDDPRGDLLVVPVTHAGGLLALPTTERGKLMAGVERAVRMLNQRHPGVRLVVRCWSTSVGGEHFCMRVYRGVKE